MARTRIPDDFVDLGIGEPYFLKEGVSVAHDLHSFEFTGLPNIWEYAPPNGYEPLVKLLEGIHRAPVVVTVGAKHGLFAALHALKETGVRSIAYRRPYWASFPHMIEHMGLRSVTTSLKADARLLVMPNNPDGHVMPLAEAKEACLGSMPVIHDAAYYTHSYLDEEYSLEPLGDLQVFSASKMFGLSGLRLGWVVCHNRAHYKRLTAYVEATTAGVSTASQRVLLALLEAEQADPTIRKRYMTAMRHHLTWAQEALRDIRPDVLVPQSTFGMFGWCRKGPKFDPQRSKVNVMDGAAFGDPSMVRLNLAVSKVFLRQAIKRLNGVP